MRVAFLVFLLSCFSSLGWGAVSITAATGGVNICSNKAVGGSAAGFTTLGPISITEGVNSDFSGGASVVDVIVLNAPSGWQFSSTLPSFSFISGSNITAVSGVITSSTLTINISVNNTTNADQVTISGLQVQATSAGSSSGSIYASFVSGVAGITTGGSGSNFGNLSLLSPATPSVSITATPSGAICPGTSVTFTPTAVNGGSAPIFNWMLNGANVAIGGAYANNSLSTGNTISCTMTSSNTCVTTNPVMSNTITMTVITAPAAITGTTTICPGMTAALSDATTGGTWSSSNTSVATISSSGLVTAIATGTARISYIAGGCPATAIMYINAPPLVPALTPTATAICNGGSLTIANSGTTAPSTIISQNFNGGVAPWTVDNTGSVGTLPGSEWKSCGDGYINEQGVYHSPDNSSFVMSNSDTSGSSSYTASKLISPVFSLYGYSSATLSFQHSYDYWPSGDINVMLEISTNGGSSWSTIANYLGATIGSKNSFVSQTYSLNAYLGNTEVMIRYNYYCHWGYFWAIDNVLITGTPSFVTPTWSPVTHLFSDASFSTPYTAGTALNTVYVHPTTVSSPATVTYTVTAVQGGCTSTATSVVSINPAPGSTSGNMNICVGTTSTLTNGASGGSWVSGNSSIATVGSSSGVVTGVAIGTAAISYVAGSSCVVVSIVTVNSAPAAISGSLHLCLGNTSTLTDASTGGTWASSNSAVAPIVSTTGVITASALGTANITYSLGAGCIATAIVTVHSLPSSITGTTVVCAGQTTTLNNATTGGSWSSGATGIATVSAASGIVTGVAGGTVNITYTVTFTGCIAVAPVTVNPMGPITGSPNICLGLTSALGNIATGGTWASSNPSIASIDIGTGAVTGIATGTAVITYLISATGCAAYMLASVYPLPADITGTQVVCMGASTLLADATSGGTWSSSAPSIANVTSGGTVNGVLAGTSVITFTASTGCFKTAIVSVNPAPAAILGPGALCVGGNVTLTNATSGGTWSSSNAAYATIGSSGNVAGISAGTVYITYTLPTGCFITRQIIVNPLPSAISGTDNVCQGLTTSLSTGSTGGTWSSSNVSIASITSTGVVTGGIAGTATITYALSTGCIATYPVTVNSLPLSITGPSSVCTGTSIALADASSGGTWSSSNPSNATVDATGNVTGILPGTVTVMYTLPTGCVRSASIAINPSPAPITGSSVACVGFTTLLSNASILGSWSSSNTSVASVVSTTGLVTGIAPGTTIITYALASGCMDTALIMVYGLPAAITGSASLCLGQTSALSNSSTGGTWSSSIATVASIGSGTGIVTGTGLGTAIITYTLLSGCVSSIMVTVNPLPSPISGASNVCVGSSTNLSTLSPGGTWSSSNESIATVFSTSGIVSGISAGTVAISYTLPTGCVAIKLITVNPVPAAIAGPGNICQSATAVFTNATTGGTWSSSTIGVATIGSSTGIANGIASGAAVITYSLGTGCFSVAAVTVTALPALIGGSGNVCVGAAALLTDATGGGSWISGSPSIASIGATTGLVNGIAAGTSIITYALPVGCVSAFVLTVNPLPMAITGNASLCLGQPVTLANGTAGGAWSSSSPSIANINPATGVVVGLVSGTATITYTLITGCTATVVVTVNIIPSAIAGPAGVCIGYTATLNNSVGGGIWSSSNTALATINSGTGLVSGIAAGPVTITYTLSTGCLTTKNINVNTLPAPITGIPVVCQGLSTILSSTTTGGTWSSSNTSVAVVGLSTGNVSGTSPGIATISYTLPTGCFAISVVTVYALPAPIGGNANVCLGFTSALTTTTPGGSWSSGNPAVATIDAVSAVVSGVSLGTSVITYAIGTGCSVYKTVTVNSLPDAISGTFSTCPGVPVSLTNTTAGGSWSSGVPAIGTINSSTGMVTALSAGTVIMSYTVGTGCFSTAVFTVNTVSPVLGNSNICMGALNTLTNAVTGGTWTSSNTSVANVGLTSGIVVGFVVSTAIITYKLPGGCIATHVVSVNALPAPITGAAIVCPGFTTALSSITPGGTWLSANPAYATVGASTGIVTGVIAGTTPSYVSIIYSVPTGCSTSRIVTVNPLPAAITGTSSICVGMASVFSSAASGGTWTSSNPAVASVGFTSGLVSGLAVGTAGITYTPASGCIATTVVTVNGLPSSISGSVNLCTGLSSTLTDGTPGGTWSSTNAAVASITSGGVVIGVAPGTSVISYTAGIGCAATAIVTVNTMPAPITGIASVCQGYTTNLGSTPAGGSWTSGNTALATVSTSGLVSGIAPGTVVISYSFSSGCAVSKVITVSVPPTAIAGITNACVGLTSTLTDLAAGGGTWSSGNTAIATVGSGTGIVTGVSMGSTNITYTIGTGCSVIIGFTVYPLPLPITGALNACVGMTTPLSDGSPGGTWSSSNAAVAPISTGGVVSGLSIGTAMITYTLPTGCIAANMVTINPLPGAVTGPGTVCQSSSVSLSNIVSGGSWASSNIAVGTVSPSSGIVTGISGGTTVVSYIVGAGCSATTIVTVYPLPASISGVPSVCQGLTTHLTNSTGGGTWSSSNPSVASVDATGIVTGLNAGTSSVSYTIGTGCSITKEITVHPLSPVTGNTTLCAGFTTALLNAGTGGAWSSSSPSVAIVNTGTGVVTGITPGTSVITYLLPTGCKALTTVNVIPVTTITGTGTVCVGQTTSLANSSSGGTWTSGNISIASVNSATGVVTGVAAGTATVSYTFGNGCVATLVVTVQPLSPITGSNTVCAGLTTTLSNATPGGSWSSGNPSVATVGATSGPVSGVSPGTAVITYLLSTGCSATRTITVNPLAPITGIPAVCAGSSISLGNANTSGAWSSDNSAVATVTSLTGTVLGVNPGNTTIAYVLPTGCAASVTVTVNPLPAPITGAANICVGAGTILSNAATGGTWSSGSTGIATVEVFTGSVTGIAAGAALITYTLPTGCVVTRTIIVNSLPAALTGSLHVCAGLTTTLTSANAGGTWSSTNTSVASVAPATGLVSGIAPGTVTIVYTLGTGCSTSAILTVDPLPSVITGSATVCVGQTTSLSSLVTSGTWSSSNTSVASVGLSSGIVTGIASGTSTITFVLPTGCIKTLNVTVNPLPAAITGNLNVCTGLTSSLASATVGGVWLSSTPGIAAVDASTGTVTGIATGTSLITYSLFTGCFISAVATVNPLPAPVAAGVGNICVGLSFVVTDATPGGIWISNTPSVASVSTSGLVTGISAGFPVISYLLPTGCFTSAVITVNPLPAAIAGVPVVCENATIVLSNSVPGGSWSCSDPGKAAVNPATGMVTGIVMGTATITYTLPTGCLKTAVVTVNHSPAAISGTPKVCAGFSTILSDITPAGTWSIAGPGGIASISGSGTVSGIAPGTVTVSYTLVTGCAATATFTVNSLPPAIGGSGNICSGSSLTLTNAVSGGTWVSSNPAIAAIGIYSGILSGTAAGTAIVTYTLSTGCSTISVIHVDPLPAPVSGPSHVCIGVNAAFTNPTPGGVWTSSNTTVATIGASSGIASGITAGTSVIAYTLPSGCSALLLLSVDPLPSAISGSLNACQGITSVFASSPGSGAWSSSSPAVITVDPVTGAASGLVLGTANIVYTLPTGCSRAVAVTVNPVPTAISGITTVCQGLYTSLSNPSPDGIWSSSNPVVAGIEAASGFVTGLAAGTSTIHYSFASGCSASVIVTVHPLLPIDGMSNGCVGDSIYMSNTVPGGTWSSSTVGVAGISSSGVVACHVSGVAVISYTLASGCTAVRSVTVNTVPVAFFVTGGGSFCVGNPGVHVGLNSSVPGFVYYLYDGSMPVGTLSGTGSALDFGPQVAGVYTITALNLGTGCSRAMIGEAVVTEVAYGPAVVTISTPGSDTVCASSTTLFTATTYLGGSSPTFRWYVNDSLSGTSATFSYVPADGDVITCRLHSNASCAVPDTAITSRTLTVIPNVAPAVTIDAVPGDTVCQFSPVLFTPVPVYGGLYPHYKWVKNGTFVDTGASYTYSPTNGDNISCVLISDERCKLSDTALSNTISMTVAPYIVPSVSITANPGFDITEGQMVSFTALVTNGGATPSYQWKVNSLPVPGSNTSVFATDKLGDKDTVACDVVSSGICSGITSTGFGVVSSKSLGVTQSQTAGNGMIIMPNPNNGLFTVKGNLGCSSNQPITLQVTDMLGQLVFENTFEAVKGVVNSRVILSKDLASGIYLLTLRSEAGTSVFHFVVKK